MFEGLKQAFRNKFGGVDPALQVHMMDSKPTVPGTPDGLRDTLFADLPLPQLLASLAPEAQSIDPWAILLAAQNQIGAGHKSEAIRLLQSVLHRFESRIDLIAWTTLRTLGVQPSPDEAKRVLGVVVEVPVEYGLDLVAAYPEHTARYFNYSGAGVVWEAHDPEIDRRIDTLLVAGQRVADAIGPWQGERPAVPANNRTRISMLTPSGLHFGEGPTDAFMQDAYAGPVIAAAFRLMQSLMKKHEDSQQRVERASSSN